MCRQQQKKYVILYRVRSPLYVVFCWNCHWMSLFIHSFRNSSQKVLSETRAKVRATEEEGQQWYVINGRREKWKENLKEIIFSCPRRQCPSSLTSVPSSQTMAHFPFTSHSTPIRTSSSQKTLSCKPSTSTSDIWSPLVSPHWFENQFQRTSKSNKHVEAWGKVRLSASRLQRWKKCHGFFFYPAWGWQLVTQVFTSNAPHRA